MSHPRSTPSLRRWSPALAVLLVAVLASPGLASDHRDPEDPLISGFTQLGLSEPDIDIHIRANTWRVGEPTLFNFAASLDPPSIDPTSQPWGVPEQIGVTWAVWTDPATLPDFPVSATVMDGALYLPGGGPELDTEYALMWAQMGGNIPVEDPMELFQNWSFPFAVPGQPTWVPSTSFPFDTWGGASVIPHITYGPNPWEIGLSEVQPDGTLALRDFNGFAIIAADTIVVGVDRAALLTNGAEGLLYGFAGHIHDGRFGATPESMSLVSYATGLPGSLLTAPTPSLLVVGTTPAPTTTTSSSSSTSSSTSTTLGSTNATDAAGGGSEGGDTESSDVGGFPLLAVVLGLLGIAVIVIGGRMFFVAAGDPCEDLLKAWRDAQAACDSAKATADGARTDCAEVDQRVADLEKQVNDLCKKWPPACEEEGSSAETSGHPESRVTSRDLHGRRIALGRLWDDYRAGKVSAEEVEQTWKTMDTPRFRDELQRETAAKATERERLEQSLKQARKDAHDRCAEANEAAKKANETCHAAEAARMAYEDCKKEEAAEDFVDAFMDLGSAAAASHPAPTSTTSITTPTPQTGQAERKVGVPVPIDLDTSGLSGDEATRARKLERIFANRKGTGDLAGVALDLYQFNAWHEKTFGEPWYTWSTGERNPNSPTSTAGASERFMQTRVMACYEFVHFCAYIASDQLGRQRVGGDDMDKPIFLDEYSVDWGFEDEINTNTQPLTDQAPRGSVVTGSFRWGDYDNSAGYYHTGISIGDGKIISLGSDGLILEDTTGKLGGCFPTAGYTNIQFGDYAYGKDNPAPQTR